MRSKKQTATLILRITFVVFLALSFQLTGQTSQMIQRSRQMEARGLSLPYQGITTDGNIISGLFPIQATGVSTAPMRESAVAFLEALTPEQHRKTLFPVDDPEWRKWMNQHFYVRQGVGFDEMSPRQRQAAFAMIGSALSTEGLKLSRDIMKLNHTLGEIKNNFTEYGQWLLRQHHHMHDHDHEH